MPVMDGESHNAQEARVEGLWKKLDIKKQGCLDLASLREGLQKIDHPLKNAEELLKDVLKVVDTDGDERIQYSEFRTFVEQTEKELWQLFKSIDRDHNGQLDKSELKIAFRRAGLVIPSSKLDQFFSEVDTNHDGVISFDEWRNFLLFIPAPSPNLKAVLSYYTSTVTVNPEGDVHVSDETIQGLGRAKFLNAFFGSLVAIATPQTRRSTVQPPILSQIPEHQTNATEDIHPSLFPWDPGEETQVDSIEAIEPVILLELPVQKSRFRLLTDFLPHPGYFIAGGIAGVVSRTITAPLDRLKVYLIAQIGTKDEAVQAVKSGAPMQATKLATRPLVEATKALWRMGGIQSMFAGNGLNVLKVMPESAIKFGSYEGSRRALARLEGHDDPRALHQWSQFVAGGIGGMISQFSIYPLDTLKFRMQCETVEGGLHGNKLIFATAQKMWRANGVTAFYRGLPMGLIGVFPYSAIDLTTYEYLKKLVTARNARKGKCHEADAAPGNFMTAAIGAFSGALGASMVYPINLLRTRLQSQGTAIHPPTYSGIWDVTVKTVTREGYRGLFKGITPNLLKVVPAVSITYVVYDNSKRVLGLR